MTHTHTQIQHAHLFGISENTSERIWMNTWTTQLKYMPRRHATHPAKCRRSHIPFKYFGFHRVKTVAHDGHGRGAMFGDTSCCL